MRRIYNAAAQKSIWPTSDMRIPPCGESRSIQSWSGEIPEAPQPRDFCHDKFADDSPGKRNQMSGGWPSVIRPSHDNDLHFRPLSRSHLADFLSTGIHSGLTRVDATMRRMPCAQCTGRLVAQPSCHSRGEGDDCEVGHQHSRSM